MPLYDKVSALPLVIDSYELAGRQVTTSSDFVRRTTIIRLKGDGHEGLGEDVTYDGDDQLALQEAPRDFPLAGAHTLDSFSELLGRLNLFPSGPGREAFVQYRRWAFESAALDLALRQAGTTLHEAVGRESRPVRFVVSMRLPGDPPTADRVKRWLELNPGLEFKLDPTSAWTDELVAELAATGAVESADLKGRYEGTAVDQRADPELYARVANGLPDAWIEDPALTPETDEVLALHRHRITWDAPIHSVGDVEGLPFPPRTLNVKPSRSGSIRELFALYDYCAEHGIGLYGGGQFELGPGRGQIQYLASVFHPDGPNDVAPGAYNDPEPTAGLPASPLEPVPDAIGFRWVAPYVSNE
jgi:L-alanine-DL-glutamate epimerase-like enolase superfamily enzyme